MAYRNRGSTGGPPDYNRYNNRRDQTSGKRDDRPWLHTERSERPSWKEWDVTKPNDQRKDEKDDPWKPDQNWKIKDTTWKSGGKKQADNRDRDSGTLQPIISSYALEDPMYEYIQQKKLREKEERIRQLQALLDSSTSSSDSDDSDHGKHKKKKKQKKKKKKKKNTHAEDNATLKDSLKRQPSLPSSEEKNVRSKNESKHKKDSPVKKESSPSSSEEKRVRNKSGSKRKKDSKKQEKSHKKKKKDESDHPKVKEEKVFTDSKAHLKVVEQESDMTEMNLNEVSVPIKPDFRSIEILLKKMRSQTDTADNQAEVMNSPKRKEYGYFIKVEKDDHPSSNTS